MPEVEAMMGEEFAFGDGSYGCAGFEAEGETGTHDAGEDGYGQSFAEVVVGFAGFGFFFGGDFAFLRETCGSVDGYGDEADGYAGEDDLARGLVEDRVDGAIVDGWDEGSEGSAEAEGDGVAEGEAEVADGEAEGETADAPEGSPEEGVVDAGGGGFVKDAEEVGDEEGGEDDGGDDPCGEALDEPVDLPRPAPDAAEGNEVGGGCETADPVKDDSEKRIWPHVTSQHSVIMILRREPSYLSVVRCGMRLNFALRFRCLLAAITMMRINGVN